MVDPFYIITVLDTFFEKVPIMIMDYFEVKSIRRGEESSAVTNGLLMYPMYLTNQYHI